ncbi:hypothetical protein Tco_0957574 [Tanacetum coccineum]
MIIGREDSPALGFSTLTPLPDPNIGELPPITASTFTTRSPDNTPLANIDHKRHVRNEDLRREFDYYSEECDKEIKMEPLSACVREATPILRTGSSRIRIHRGRVIEFEEALNRDGSKVERESNSRRPSGRRAEESGSHRGNLPSLLIAHLGRSENGKHLQSTLTSGYGGNQPLTNSRGNLPPNGTYLLHNALPFIPNSLQPPINGQMPIYANPYSQSNAGITYSQPSSFSFHTLGNNPSFKGASTCLPYEGYTQQASMSNYGPSHNKPMYPSNIEDYPLPDGLKMPSHVVSYDGKGDLNNYLHLFEGSIRMQKWAILVACHMFTYTLKDSAWMWWNGQKAGSIVNYEDLKAKFQSHFSQQKKFTKTHLAVHNIKKRDGESTRAFDNSKGRKKNRERAQIFGRQVNWVYMDSDSSCEVIYEHYFLKLEPYIRSLRVDSKIPLIGLLEEHS